MKKSTWNNLKVPRNPAEKTGYAASTKASMAFAKPAGNGLRNCMTALPRKGSPAVLQNTAYSPARTVVLTVHVDDMPVTASSPSMAGAKDTL